MKTFNQFLIALVLGLTSQLPLTAHANAATQSLTKEFTVTATGHFCYQTFEDAYNQALNELHRKADKNCSPNRSQIFSGLRYNGGGCSVQLKAEFICSDSDIPYCKPEKYWIRCCDKNGCWIDG